MMARMISTRGRQAFLSALYLLTLLLFLPLNAQDQSPLVVRMEGISGEGISQGELDSLAAMIVSYVSELEGFIPWADASDGPDAPPGAGAPEPQDLPAYRLSGKISQRDGDFIFTLDSAGRRNGEKRSISESFDSVNDIVLKARHMTRAVLLGDVDGATLRAEDSRPADGDSGLEGLAGIWKGDKGIDRVRLGGDGSGSAILSSGHAMRLKVSLREGRVVIEQDQPAEAAFFASPKYSMETAREIALKARPMRWIFRLSEDGRTLSGMKESVAVQRGTDGILRVDNAFDREAAWTRLR